MSSSLWPAGCEGAVSLTFDDGMRSHLQTVHPMLGEHDLRATFYVLPSKSEREETWREQLQPWRAVAASGHEIGNHSLTHPCSANHPWVDRGVEDWTLAELERDFLEAERRLREGVPEYAGARSFCYPCYQSHIGVGPNRQSYVPLVAEHFPAARSKGDKPNSATAVDLHYIWSWGVERCSGPDLIGLCEWAALEGRWAVLTFHGINEGHLSVASADLQLLLRHLDRHRDRIWTAPLIEVAQHVQQLSSLSAR